MWPFNRKSRPSRHAMSVRYSGASVDRLTADWRPQDWTPNLLIQQGMSTLRARAQDLERDNPYVRRFLQMMAANVVGHNGVKLQSLAADANGKPGGAPDNDGRSKIEAAWQDWGKRSNASADGQCSFRGLTSMVLRRMLVDGECFARKVRGPLNPHGYALEIIEPMAVDETKNERAGSGRPEIRLGVELGAYRRPAAYWIKTMDDHGPSGISARIPASDIIHIFIRERPQQVRGVTWLAPTMLRTRMLDAYEHATVVAARTAAAKMGFFETDGETYQGAGPDAQNFTTMDAEPGHMEQLPVGVKFSQWDPTYPPTNFAEFESEIKRGLASGLGVSYVTLANNLEGVSYSSIRQGSLDDRDFYRMMQAEIVEQWCQPNFEAWLTMALTAGSVALPIQKEVKWRAARWVPRGWGWVDPLKEIQAVREELALNLTTRGRVAAESGEDIEEIFADIEREGVLAASHNIPLVAQSKPVIQEPDPDPETDKSVNDDE